MAAFDVPVPAGTTQSTPPAGTTQSTPPTDPYAGMSPVQSIQQINQQQGVYGAENAGQEKSPDYWTGLAARARTLPSKLAAGGYEAANTMLYGIPDVVVKAASSDAYKKLQDLRAANPGATLLGAGAGLALGLATGSAESGGAEASALPLIGPGGLVGAGSRVLSGAGKLAEKVGAEGLGRALGKAGEAVGAGAKFLRGGGEATSFIGKVGQGAAQGAALGAEQNIVPVLGGTETPAQGALGVGLGGAIGGLVPVASGFLRALGTTAKQFNYAPAGASAIAAPAALSETASAAAPVSEGINEALMGKFGVGMRSLKASGHTPDEIMQLKQSLGDLINGQKAANGGSIPQNSLEMNSLLDSVNKAWNGAIGTAEKAGIDATTLEPEIQALPEVQALQATPQGQQAYAAIAKRLQDNQGNLTAQRMALNSFIEGAAPGPGTGAAMSNALQDEGSAASSIKDLIDSKIGEVVPDFDAMKQDYGAVQLLKKSQMRVSAAVPKMEAGSPTAARTAVGGMLGVGLEGKDALKELDPNDPATWSDAALKLAAATVIGSAVGGVSSKLMSSIQGNVAAALKNPTFQAVLAKAVPAVAKYIAPVNTTLERGASMIPSSNGAQIGVNPEAAARMANETNGLPPDTPTPSATPASGVAPDVQANNNQATAVQRAAASAKTNQQFQAAIEQRLETEWNEKFSTQMDFDTFKQRVAAVTDNFNPLYSAKVLFQDPAMQEQYLNDYNTVLKVQSANPSQAYESFKTTKGLLGGLDPQRAIKQEGFNNLVDLIASATTKEGPPTAQRTKDVQTHVGQILDMPGTPEQKNQKIIQLLGQRYKLGSDTLSSLGLI